MALLDWALTLAGGIHEWREKPARAEFHMDNPPPDRFDYRVAATPDPVPACMLNWARKEKLSVERTQTAVCIHTDHVTFTEIADTAAGLAGEPPDAFRLSPGHSTGFTSLFSRCDYTRFNIARSSHHLSI